MELTKEEEEEEEWGKKGSESEGLSKVELINGGVKRDKADDGEGGGGITQRDDVKGENNGGDRKLENGNEGGGGGGEKKHYSGNGGVKRNEEREKARIDSVKSDRYKRVQEAKAEPEKGKSKSGNIDEKIGGKGGGAEGGKEGEVEEGNEEETGGERVGEEKEIAVANNNGDNLGTKVMSCLYTRNTSFGILSLPALLLFSFVFGKLEITCSRRLTDGLTDRTLF